MKKSRVAAGIATTLLAATLAACGGGGGGGDTGPTSPVPPPQEKPTAEGVYGGTLTGNSVGSYFETIILENGEFWVLYGDNGGGSIFSVYGFAEGVGTSDTNNGTFTAKNAKDYGVLPPVTGSLSATYVAASKTISGKVSADDGSGTLQFAGGPIPNSAYDYNVPASLSTVSGNWATVSTLGTSVMVNVSPNGALTVSEGGCTGSGTITPRASGKNIFNVSITFGGAPCALPGATVTGAAVAYPLATGQTQLVAAVKNSQRTAGIAIFGIR